MDNINSSNPRLDVFTHPKDSSIVLEYPVISYDGALGNKFNRGISPDLFSGYLRFAEVCVVGSPRIKQKVFIWMDKEYLYAWLRNHFRDFAKEQLDEVIDFLRLMQEGEDE